jgi:hypothetical protein
MAARSSHLRARDIRGIVGALMAIGLLTAFLVDGYTGWFAIPTSIGGLIAAGLLLRGHRRGWFEHLEETTDAPLSALRPTMFNMSSVKPAGVGGLGLLAMAVVMAVTFPRIEQTVGTGLIGGVIVAMLMIRYRRRHGIFTTKLETHVAR